MDAEIMRCKIAADERERSLNKNLSNVEAHAIDYAMFTIAFESATKVKLQGTETQKDEIDAVMFQRWSYSWDGRDYVYISKPNWWNTDE